MTYQDDTLLSLVSIVGYDSFDSEVPYGVECRLCGSVVNRESYGTHTRTAPGLSQAMVYQRRHLSRHLNALASEIERAVR